MDGVALCCYSANTAELASTPTKNCAGLDVYGVQFCGAMLSEVDPGTCLQGTIYLLHGLRLQRWGDFAPNSSLIIAAAAEEKTDAVPPDLEQNYFLADRAPHHQSINQ